MAKAPSFSCTICGASHSKWSGRCEDCGEWNTIQEDTGLSSSGGKASLGHIKGARVPLTDLSTEEAPPPLQKEPAKKEPAR